MKTITLTQGQVALVDDADFASVSRFNWHAVKYRNGFYAARNVRKPDGKRTILHFHQFLLPEAKEIDHMDGDGLNNQRANLRAVSSSQNHQAFRRKPEGKTSRFRGVCWHKAAQKWRAQIQFNGKLIHLGLFVSERDAARVYDVAAKQLFGDFASPNL